MPGLTINTRVGDTTVITDDQGNEILITLVRISGNQVRVNYQAPSEFKIQRERKDSGNP